MSAIVSSLARIGAYLVTLLLSAVWIVGALYTLTHPLYDLGQRNIGDVIIRVSGVFGLSPHAILQFAHLLAGLKLTVGALLLTAVGSAIRDKLRGREVDDALLDVALFVAAAASTFGALPALVHGGEPLQSAIGELMLCVIASRLAIYGRGYLVRPDIPGPARPPLGYARVE